jgi:hypothetical protein
VGPQPLLVEAGRAEADVRLGEDHPEGLVLAAERVQLGKQLAHVGHARALEELVDGDVVEVAVGVQVAVADVVEV